MRQTTLIYIEKDNKYLMLHRIKKENDFNKDKWIGVGGKIEEGETPDECVIREVKEETGLIINTLEYRGKIYFFSDKWEDEIMYLYTCSDFSGVLIECDEGKLEWIDKDLVFELPIWEGDKIFLTCLKNDEYDFELKLNYKGEELNDYLLIREAKPYDFDSILDIYNYEVLNGVATFDIKEKTFDERKMWFDNHNVNNHPLVVAEYNGVVAGYGSLSEYRQKEAYASTVELSVYVHKCMRGKKIASSLIEWLISYAKKNESIHSIVSVITSSNDVSRHLHEKYNFKYCGTLSEVGYKNGLFHDIDNYQLKV